jgi:GINS complex subunit 3
MEEDYYSINAILADNHVRFQFVPSRASKADQGSGYLQKLTCSFALDVEGLGYLEGSSEPDVGIQMALTSLSLYPR